MVGRLRAWVPVVPASLFGIVLGLAGLGSAWRVAHRVWHLPALVGELWMLLAGLVWLVVLTLYVAKWLLFRAEALAEVAQPVQCCFIGLAGVATMLVAGALLPHTRAPSVVLFVVGMLFTVGFAVWRTGGLWHGGRDVATLAPVLYLPAAAGSFITAIVAGALGYADWGQLAFGSGIFSWLAIDSVLLHRFLTGPTFAEALRPTLGIQLAPAPVAALAYLSVLPDGPVVVVHMLVGYGLLEALVLLRLSSWIRAKSPAVSFWGFTFGGTALATAPLRLVAVGEHGAMAVLAPVLFVGANGLVLIILVGTIRAWVSRTGSVASPSPTRRTELAR